MIKEMLYWDALKSPQIAKNPHETGQWVEGGIKARIMWFLPILARIRAISAKTDSVFSGDWKIGGLKKMNNKFWGWYARGLKKVFMFRWLLSWAIVGVFAAFVGMSFVIWSLLTVIVEWPIVVSLWWLCLTIPIGITLTVYGYWLMGKQLK